MALSKGDCLSTINSPLDLLNNKYNTDARSIQYYTILIHNSLKWLKIKVERNQKNYS